MKNKKRKPFLSCGRCGKVLHLDVDDRAGWSQFFCPNCDELAPTLCGMLTLWQRRDLAKAFAVARDLEAPYEH